MLTITLPEKEYYSDRTGEFWTVPAVTLQLEHSLLSISKWEAKWKKPFLTEEQKSTEEFADYVRCMTVNHVPPNVYHRLRRIDYTAINQYINDPMTATTFHSVQHDKAVSETITSEVIYYWMDEAHIDWSAEKWHLNRLLALIRVHSAKSNTQKMGKAESAKYQHSINQARRAKYRKLP